MKKLFAVFLGGRADGCNIELHDVVFTIGDSLENIYPTLANKWFGNKKRLHIDSTIELNYVDGHEVLITEEKPNESIKKPNKLFFVNFGAYKSNFFGEVHETGFYVGSSKSEVLARAKENLCLSLIESHCDDNVDIDDILTIEDVDGHYIKMIPSTKSTNLTIQSGYRRIDNR